MTKISKYDTLLEGMNNGFCMILEVYKDLKGIKLNESQVNVPEGMMRVNGIAAKIGIRNRNGRIYNKENYKKHIEILKAQIAEGLYGELEHPEGFTIDNNNISHKIENVWFDESTQEIKIELLLLDTEKGKIAQSIIKSGGALKVSSRARGYVNKNSEAIIEELITFDIVGTPGFAETKLYLSEQFQKVSSDSLCESYVVYNKNVNTINENNKFNKNIMSNSKKNQSILESALKNKSKSTMNESVDKAFLCGQFSDKLQEWLIESFAPVIQNWIVEDFAPQLIEYQTKKQINESLGKSAISFKTFVDMAINESQRKLIESKQQQRQQQRQILTQEQQQVIAKLQQQEALTDDEQVILQQIAKQQEVKESQQQQKQLLTQEQQQVIDKLQQQEALTDEEKVILQQISKQQQKQQQSGTGEIKESLILKRERINESIKNKYRSLLESQDEESQEKVNQEIQDLEDELKLVQEKIDDCNDDETEKIEESQQQQFEKVMQMVQDGQEIEEEDIKDLNQTQIQQILDASKTNESEEESDDKSKKQQGEGLPTKEDEQQIKESLLEQKATGVLKQSNSLLESIQKRMNEYSKKK